MLTVLAVPTEVDCHVLMLLYEVRQHIVCQLLYHVRRFVLYYPVLEWEININKVGCDLREHSLMTSLKYGEGERHFVTTGHKGRPYSHSYLWVRTVAMVANLVTNKTGLACNKQIVTVDCGVCYGQNMFVAGDPAFVCCDGRDRPVKV